MTWENSYSVTLREKIENCIWGMISDLWKQTIGQQTTLVRDKETGKLSMKIWSWLLVSGGIMGDF